MRYLPGDIADPNWSGARCKDCGRALGGDMVSCTEYAENGMAPKPHLTLESIPAAKKLAWFVPRICSNLLQAGLDQLAAAEWLCTAHPSLGGKRPIDVIRDDRAPSVYELQYAEWPVLRRVEQSLAGLAA
jgi:hypothetical protein